MSPLVIIAIIVIVVVAILNNLQGSGDAKKSRYNKAAPDYKYTQKDTVMSVAEASFYKRLETVVDGKYYIFPQVHLSSLMLNKTYGKYNKLGFQRIQRRSVDYVLCDKETMAPVYAVELDDSTHDCAKRQTRDSMVENMLAEIDLPLIRFRNVSKVSDADIEKKFADAASNNMLK